METIPYTYLIGWSKNNKWYYGVKFAKGCNPNMFWKEGGYFTSSEYVKEYRKIHGEPDVIQIRKKFNCPIKACRWEEKVLNKMGVIKENSDMWLNKCISRAISTNVIIESNKNRQITEESKLKNSESIKEWWDKRKEKEPNFIGNRRGLTKVRNIETGEIREMEKGSYDIYVWGGLNNKRIYCTPHGKFTGKNNIPQFYIDKVSYNSLLQMCIYNKKVICWRRVNASKFLSKDDIGKTCEDLGYYTI
jgi:hypothetical protein